MGHNELELLTVEEFAKRMGVSRTTIFEWKRRGLLKPGMHYLQIGRIIRFEWRDDLVSTIYESIQAVVKPVVTKKTRKCFGPNNSHKAPINWDY